MQKTEVEQAKEKELDVALQKLSEKELEIKKMRQEVSRCLGVFRVCYTLKCSRQRNRKMKRSWMMPAVREGAGDYKDGRGS